MACGHAALALLCVLSAGLAGTALGGNSSNGSNASNRTNVTVKVVRPLVSFVRLGGGECLSPSGDRVRGRARRDLSHQACRDYCSSSVCLGYTYAPCITTCTIHGDPDDLAVSDQDGWWTISGGGTISGSSGLCGWSCFHRVTACANGTILSAGTRVSYPTFRFGTSVFVDCKFPFKGTLQLACALDGVRLIGGRCLRPCAPGTVVDGQFEVNYPPIVHDEDFGAPCPPGVSGTITMTCVDSKASAVDGSCGYDCAPGSVYAGVAMLRYPVIGHQGTLVTSCPSGFVGNPVLQCTNGIVQLISGRCDSHCQAASEPLQIGNSSGIAVHGAMLHNQQVVVPCGPDIDLSTRLLDMPGYALGNLTGNVTLACRDGVVSVNSSGRCLAHCQPGSIFQRQRAVRYGVLQHGQNYTMACNPGFVGSITVGCQNGVALLLEGYCSMVCQPGTVTSNGVTFQTDSLMPGQNITLQCPKATHTGILSVFCEDGAMTVRDSMCGMNCPAGALQSKGVWVGYPPIDHMERFNATCPEPFSSALQLKCYDGSIRSKGWCRMPCAGGIWDRNGAIVRYGAMNDSQTVVYPCISKNAASVTFSGSVEVRCDDGVITFGGACYADCSGGKLRNNGADVLYPPLQTGASTVVTCQPNDNYGNVTVSCQLGFTTVVSGTCGRPCTAGFFSAAVTRYQSVFLEEVGHTRFITFDCPIEKDLSGVVTLKCTNGLYSVVSGQCGERCPAAPVVTFGASFRSPNLAHLEIYQQACVWPFRGDIVVLCNFGYLNVTSRCQTGCFSGSLVLDSGAVVGFPDMMGNETFFPTCPQSYLGVVELICINGTVQVASGGCNSPCEAGQFVRTAGGEEYIIQYLRSDHDAVQDFVCPIGFNGSVRLRCRSGTMELAAGACSKSCVPGQVIVRPGVRPMNDFMSHNTYTPVTACPEGFTGAYQLLCWNGVVNVSKGSCSANCQPMTISGAVTPVMQHGRTAGVRCPEKGSLTVSCTDGLVKVVSGLCRFGCKSSLLPDANGSLVQYLDLKDGDSTLGLCVNPARGSITVLCNNSEAILTPMPGQRCLRPCAKQSLVTPDGTTISAEYLEHMSTAAIQCPNGKLGVVTVQCEDSVTSVVDGICGNANCAAGQVLSGGALVSYPPMNDGRQAGPQTCAAGSIGQAYVSCRSGGVTVAQVTVSLTVEEVSEGPNVVILDPRINDTSFPLCGCCTPSMTAPEVQPLTGYNGRTVIIWASCSAGAVLVVAGMSGLWFLRSNHLRMRRKNSRVAPALTDLRELANTFDEVGKKADQLVPWPGPRQSQLRWATESSPAASEQMSVERLKLWN